ncbi:MAG TPA: winged helix-turn-helix domain-containing protein [Rubrobacteraceae bacterium]|nr:winged helix-turn-helix domain-containing protein [Rubrobacteraceae bacterium]
MGNATITLHSTDRRRGRPAPRDRNATQLAEALKESLGVKVTPEAVRQHLHSMGYSWKRTRYVPSQPPDPEQERKAREELEDLKKGRPKERSS